MKAEWHLLTQDYFSGLNAEREIFVSLAKKRVVRRHEIVFRQGEATDSAYYLEEGRIRIYRVTPEGKEAIFFIRNAGEMFGLAEVFGGARRTCNARAMTCCTFFEITRPDLETLLSRSWPLARRVMETLGGRLRFLGEQVGNVMSCSVTARLEKLLYYLSCQESVHGSGSGPVERSIKLTQEDIAAMIGSCQQTVSEVLKQLENEGLIRISSNRREITVRDPARLSDSVY